tara:strand:- start:4946 stop:5158 length:213 start_codon:yes stop_codon:yes gene_type:complete
MLRLLPIILLFGCSCQYTPHYYKISPKPSDINWVEVYRKEIIIAVENDDKEAWFFFWREYLLEKSKFIKK